MIFCMKTAWVLRAVFVNLNSDGWNVYANLVENPNRWNIDNQVFSSNCYFRMKRVKNKRAYSFVFPSK